jgi:putative ABC transport system permease protein
VSTASWLARASRTELLRALGVALEAIRVDRVRTRAALVALALAMSIVVCLTTLVERGRAATIRSLERAGLKNLYLVARGEHSSVEALTRSDAERLRSVLPVRAEAALRMERVSVTIHGTSVSAPLYAVSGSWNAVFAARAASGRLLGDLDVALQSPYCVLGRAVAREAGLATPVGSIVNVGTKSYEVVGEMAEFEAEGASVGEIPALDWNRAVLVPLGTEPQAHLQPQSDYPIDVAVLAFSQASRAGRTAALLPAMDAGRFGPGGSVRVAAPVQTLRQYKQTRRTFDRIVWLVGLLTALSAVAGISNLLSASVVARTREIGLRRAVGARSQDITLQFQAEGLLLAVLGGGVGLLVGAAVSLATVDRSGSGSSLSLLSFSGLAILCVVIGILTGIRPSLRASRIDPAQALREG